MSAEAELEMRGRRRDHAPVDEEERDGFELADAFAAAPPVEEEESRPSAVPVDDDEEDDDGEDESPDAGLTKLRPQNLSTWSESPAKRRSWYVGGGLYPGFEGGLHGSGAPAPVDDEDDEDEARVPGDAAPVLEELLLLLLLPVVTFPGRAAPVLLAAGPAPEPGSDAPESTKAYAPTCTSVLLLKRYHAAGCGTAMDEGEDAPDPAVLELG